MAESKDAAARRAQKVAKMGPELGELHDDLWNEVAWAHAKWQEYRRLYGTDEATIAILNAAAPTFFYFLNDILFDDVLLNLTRLTDPPEYRGQGRLTLQSLPPLVTDPALRTKVEDLLAVVMTRTEFARDRRNRRIVHRDLRTLRGSHPTPLAGASRQNVEDALAAVRKLMNTIEQELEDSTTAYEGLISTGGAAWLTACLEVGVRYREEDTKRRIDLQMRGIDPDAG